MGYIKSQINKLIKDNSGKANARKASEEWFEKAIKSRKINEAASSRDRFLPGKIYVFEYKPITENLPWFDRNPVVLAIERVGNNDLGVNLNLLPVEFKEKLLDKLYDMMEGQIKNASAGNLKENAIKQKPLRITNEGVKTFLQSEGYEFAIRQYIPSRKIKQSVVSYENWAKIILCDFIDLEGITINQVKKLFKINQSK